MLLTIVINKIKKVLYKLVSNILFGQLLEILTKDFIFLKTFNSEFLCIDC